MKIDRKAIIISILAGVVFSIVWTNIKQDRAIDTLLKAQLQTYEIIAPECLKMAREQVKQQTKENE